jgi:hypothetical protein
VQFEIAHDDDDDDGVMIVISHKELKNASLAAWC